MKKKQLKSIKLTPVSYLIGEGAINQIHKELGLNRIVTRLLLSINAIRDNTGNALVSSGKVRVLVNSILPFSNNNYTLALTELEKRGLIEKNIHYSIGKLKKLYICITGLGEKVIKRFNQLLCEMTEKVTLFNA